jgi:hypothetical protein
MEINKGEIPMLAFKYSEFAHLIQTEFWYMTASTGAIAVVCCGVTIAVVELVKPLLRRGK